MASWADEFDIDDSDILGAFINRRKDPSQLASPPWPPAEAGGVGAAAPAPRPHLPLSSSSSQPHPPIISSAGLLKRFQRPTPSFNRTFLSQNVTEIAPADPLRKRKQGSDLAPQLPPKTACRESPNVENDIRGNNPSSSIHHISPQRQSQEPDEGCNGMYTVDEQCHSLSSHGVSPARTAGETFRCHSKYSQPQNHTRHEDLESSQQPLRDIQQNVQPSHVRVSMAGAPAARQSLKQNPVLEITLSAQTHEVGGEKRQYKSANVPQLDHNMEDRMHNVETNISERPLGMQAPTSLRRSAPGVRAETAHRKNVERLGSRGARLLEKDLQYQIPGPAGAVQRGLGLIKSSFSENSRIRKKNQAPGGETASDDADFQSGVWLKAKNHIEKSSVPVSTISSLKTSRRENRVFKLLAVIKSCMPNGCGDALVSLKDQTDSIYGTINRRVMSETEFGRIIEPGAVILLHQVAVFSPTPYAHYLNITTNNVEQVFAKGLQFFKGECSHAASKAVLDMTEDEQMDDIEDPPTKSKARMVDFHNAGKNVHSKISELLEEEDELEIILAHSAHQTTHEHMRNGTEATTSDGIQLVEGGSPCQLDYATRDQVDKLHVDPIDDGYDQLLDDTDLFPCIQTRSRFA